MHPRSCPLRVSVTKAGAGLLQPFGMGQIHGAWPLSQGRTDGGARQRKQHIAGITGTACAGAAAASVAAASAA